MNSGMRFLQPEEFVSNNELIFSEIQLELISVFPYFEIEHIGSSAIHGAISKGDLDILVRVQAIHFEQALSAIQTLNFTVKEGTLRTKSLCMLESRDYAVDVAIQLIEAGSEFENFVIFRDKLNANPELVEKYNQLKTECTGLAPDDYRSKKSEFIEQVLTLGD